mmetsp:Transcript_23233/g.58711  ORF Transcript_23233/g.58711 Transcript_23233/m.58711 type:complete len:439 (-) Transcript_23233:24-1340(-)
MRVSSSVVLMCLCAAALPLATRGEELESTLQKSSEGVKRARLGATEALAILHDKAARRKGKGGGGKSFGGGGGFSTGGKTSSGGTGTSSNGKSTYSNPAPVSSSTKTGTYRAATATGRTAAPGRATGPTRPFTSTGAAAAANFRASPVSYTSFGGRYGGGAGGIRPFYLYAAVAGGVYASSRQRECSNNRYRFGNSCRRCSAEACPIGQYRTECDAYNDGYCRECTGLPANSYWITPGNGDTCESEACTADSPCALCPSNPECPPQSTLADSGVGVTFFVESPVTLDEWNAEKGAQVKDAIAEAGRGAGVSGGDVEIASVDEATLDPADVSAGAASAERRRRFAEAGRRQEDVGCGVAPPTHDKYVVAVVDVYTSEARVEDVWSALTEYAINAALSDKCQPPTTVGYFGTGAASSARASLLGAALASVVALAAGILRN